ncbi:hypothetical protein SH661x_000074 [Planctomicrobium sp. SH661]|uniref:hypothetical protein n=1 Tax=Planctomicrobium sp. SH661 TaxID=3448124 RepID=UPI003F5C38F4
MSPRAVKIWLGVSLVVAVLAAPFLARGDQSSRKQAEQYAAQIARMSESQRARLLQNERQYLAATSEQKASMQALHHALEKDRQHGHGELNEVMHRYDAWLKTIEPYQREQLSSTTDPRKRIELMREIVRKQSERAARRNMPFPGQDFVRDRMPGDPAPVLDEKGLASVMSALRQAADPRLTPAQREELDSLQGLKRDFRLLQILQEHASGGGNAPRPLLEDPPAEFRTVTEHINDSVTDDRVRNFIHSQPPGDGPPGRSQTPESRLARVISRSLMVELFKQRRVAQQTMDSDKLRKFLLESVPPDRQYELLSLEASDFQTDLKNMYLDSQGQKDLPGMQDLRELFGRGLMRGGPGPGPGPGPDRGPFGFRDFRDGRPQRGPGGEGLEADPSQRPNQRDAIQAGEAGSQ